MNEIRFDGKIAIITGAGRGLGRLYAIELARRGAAVVVNDLGGSRDGSGSDTAPAQSVVDEIRNFGGKAIPNFDSVATIEGGEKIIQTAIDAFGTVDILINNAGILADKTIMKMSEKEWDIVQEVNLKGTFSVTRAAFPIMREKKFGRIIFTSSGSGLYGNFGQTNYAAAKMGLIGFMNALKLEGAKYNITCNTIAPIAASRLTEDVLPPELFKKLRPEDVVPLVLYLCWEGCTESGMIFNCAGGWFSRTAVVCGRGIKLGDGCNEISPEAIRDNWQKIANLENAEVLGSLVESFKFIV
ncbi:MAG: SDR family oxidoreductase [Spirochaetes bacterium]|nr:SDR family oxidoreductase [Spirochaetota bacterium]